MSRIFWDSNLFIYLFEDYGEFSERVLALRHAMLERKDQLLTSTLTLAEILVKPIERGEVETARKYEQVVTVAASLLPFDLRAAKVYAHLRTDPTLRPPDAIQLACAAAAGVDLFITNDQRLRGRHVDGIQFIAPLSSAPL
jgi:predicted nucleic acid-binding protein